MANMESVRRLDSSDAVVEAIKTATRELEPYGKVIVNIAQEQNYAGYRNMKNGVAMLYDI